MRPERLVISCTIHLYTCNGLEELIRVGPTCIGPISAGLSGDKSVVSHLKASEWVRVGK